MWENSEAVFLMVHLYLDHLDMAAHTVAYPYLCLYKAFIWCSYSQMYFCQLLLMIIDT